MIVCSCRAVCHKRLTVIIEEGARSVCEVARACGAGDDCGACRSMIEDMIDDIAASDPSADEALYLHPAAEMAR
jgi:bacterioferritin-associated ferredoxin